MKNSVIVRIASILLALLIFWLIITLVSNSKELETLSRAGDFLSGIGALISLWLLYYLHRDQKRLAKRLNEDQKKVQELTIRNNVIQEYIKSFRERHSMILMILKSINMDNNSVYRNLDHGRENCIYFREINSIEFEKLSNEATITDTLLEELLAYFENNKELFENYKSLLNEIREEKIFYPPDGEEIFRMQDPSLSESKLKKEYVVLITKLIKFINVQGD